MSRAKTTAFSGCLIWFLLITFFSICIMPFIIAAGSISSSSDLAIQTMGGFMCPENTTPESYSYASTITDEFGNAHPATAYELHCVDASGEVVKEDPIVYAFGWIGISALVGLIISVLLSFVFAVPGGMLVTSLLEKMRVKKPATNE